MLSTELAFFPLSFHCFKVLIEKDLKLFRMLFPSTKSKGHYTSNSLLTHIFYLIFQKSYPMLNICRQWSKKKSLLMIFRNQCK